jgi:hypothetical protein
MPGRDQTAHKEQAVEVVIFLLLIAPSMPPSLFVVRNRSSALAVLLLSVIFSLGHGYEAAAGLAPVGMMGAVIAVVYL